jgi:hypothetical protein
LWRVRVANVATETQKYVPNCIAVAKQQQKQAPTTEIKLSIATCQLQLLAM